MTELTITPAAAAEGYVFMCESVDWSPGGQRSAVSIRNEDLEHSVTAEGRTAEAAMERACIKAVVEKQRAVWTARHYMRCAGLNV